jgi:hypothetical protein
LIPKFSNFKIGMVGLSPPGPPLVVFCNFAKCEFRQLYFFTIVLPYILTDSIWSVSISSTILELQLNSFKMANFVGKLANWRNSHLAKLQFPYEFAWSLGSKVSLTGKNPTNMILHTKKNRKRKILTTCMNHRMRNFFPWVIV